MNKLLFVQALSPIHAGTGQSIGAVDLSIARDRATGFPYLPGSSIKGSLRARATDNKLANTSAVFGPDTANASEHAGMLAVGDANLLLLPVRSVAGTFAYVTSPYLLARFARDCRDAGVNIKVPSFEIKDAAGCKLASDASLLVNNKVVLEDFDLTYAKDLQAASFAEELAKELFRGEAIDAWKKGLINRLCIVHDDVMTFLSEHATDVVTRVSIDNETKTAKKGQLWTEENLPAETVLVSMLSAMAVNKTNLSAEQALGLVSEIAKTPIQLGGKATVGRGRCRMVVAGGAR